MKVKLTFKIWLWLIVLSLALIAILNFSNLFQEGVIIKSVDQNSSAFEEGLRQGQIITAIDGNKIDSIEDFSKIAQDKDNLNEKTKTIITTTEKEVIIYSDKFPVRRDEY